MIESGDLEKDRWQAGDEEESESGCIFSLVGAEAETRVSDGVNMGYERNRAKDGIQVLVRMNWKNSAAMKTLAESV